MCSIPTSLPGTYTSHPVTHDAGDLVPDGTTTKILLDGQAFMLRITRNGKLILNK